MPPQGLTTKQQPTEPGGGKGPINREPHLLMISWDPQERKTHQEATQDVARVPRTVKESNQVTPREEPRDIQGQKTSGEEHKIISESTASGEVVGAELASKETEGQTADAGATHNCKWMMQDNLQEQELGEAKTLPWKHGLWQEGEAEAPTELHGNALETEDEAKLQWLEQHDPDIIRHTQVWKGGTPTGGELELSSSTGGTWNC